jgi:hypothetical protein
MGQNLIEDVFFPKQPARPAAEETKEAPKLGRPPKKPEIPRGVNSARIMAEAQRVFNPALPPAPPKPPSAALLDQGTAAGLDISGRWGGKSK